MYNSVKGWIPTITEIVFSPSKVWELAQYLPHLGKAYQYVEEIL